MRCYEDDCKKQATKTLEINGVVFLLCAGHCRATERALRVAASAPGLDVEVADFYVDDETEPV